LILIERFRSKSSVRGFEKNKDPATTRERGPICNGPGSIERSGVTSKFSQDGLRTRMSRSNSVHLTRKRFVVKQFYHNEEVLS
jgi:hypothetical protein